VITHGPNHPELANRLPTRPTAPCAPRTETRRLPDTVAADPAPSSHQLLPTTREVPDRLAPPVSSPQPAPHPQRSARIAPTRNPATPAVTVAACRRPRRASSAPPLPIGRFPSAGSHRPVPVDRFHLAVYPPVQRQLAVPIPRAGIDLESDASAAADIAAHRQPRGVEPISASARMV
jgi:hypothetical protein